MDRLKQTIDNVKGKISNHTNKGQQQQQQPQGQQPAPAATMSTETFHGKCDCGAVEWEAKLGEDQRNHVICHCRTCQLLSGGSYTLNQIIPRSALTITKGESNLKKYAYKGLSGNNTDCFTCETCQSSPYHHQHVMGPDTIVLRTGLLDRASEFPVNVEIFTKNKFSWLPQIGKDTFEGPPPS